MCKNLLEMFYKVQNCVCIYFKLKNDETGFGHGALFCFKEIMLLIRSSICTLFVLPVIILWICLNFENSEVDENRQ